MSFESLHTMRDKLKTVEDMKNTIYYELGYYMEDHEEEKLLNSLEILEKSIRSKLHLAEVAALSKLTIDNKLHHIGAK